MTGVQADPHSLAPARGRDELGQLLDGAAEGPARPGGVLEVKRDTRSLSARASRIVSPARAIALWTSPRLAEPGWRITPHAPILVPTRSEWISELSDFARISASSLAQLTR